MSLIHDVRTLTIRLIWFEAERERLMHERDLEDDDPTDHGDQGQLDTLYEQYGAAIREVAELGTRASFDQKLNALRAYTLLCKYRYLLGKYREHSGERLFGQLDPDSMVGKGYRADWEAMCNPDTGRRFRGSVQRVLEMPEFALLAGYDLQASPQLRWTPDEIQRHYDESIDIGE